MYFIYNGINSRDVGLKIKDFPYDTMANRRFKELVLDRYDGTLYEDLETYESYSIDIECTLRDNFNISTIRAVKDMFKSGKGELILSHKPDNIYKVRLANNINFVEMLNLTGSCILTFKVEPFSILKSGLSYVIVPNGGKLTNAGNYASKPLIKVEGTGSISISINGEKMEFSNVNTPFIIDTELEDVYGVDNGTNLNNFMNINSDFIGFKEGENVINYTGNVTRISVLPRWREL